MLLVIEKRASRFVYFADQNIDNSATFFRIKNFQTKIAEDL